MIDGRRTAGSAPIGGRREEGEGRGEGQGRSIRSGPEGGLGPRPVLGGGEPPRVHGHGAGGGAPHGVHQQREGHRGSVLRLGHRISPRTGAAHATDPVQHLPRVAEAHEPLHRRREGRDHACREPERLGQVVRQPGRVEIPGHHRSRPREHHDAQSCHERLLPVAATEAPRGVDDRDGREHRERQAGERVAPPGQEDDRHQRVRSHRPERDGQAPDPERPQQGEQPEGELHQRIEAQHPRPHRTAPASMQCSTSSGTSASWVDTATAAPPRRAASIQPTTAAQVSGPGRPWARRGAPGPAGGPAPQPARAAAAPRRTGGRDWPARASPARRPRGRPGRRRDGRAGPRSGRPRHGRSTSRSRAQDSAAPIRRSREIAGASAGVGRRDASRRWLDQATQDRQRRGLPGRRWGP